VHCVVPVAESQAADLRSILRLDGIAAAEAMPPKSAISEQKSFYTCTANEGICDNEKQTVCQEMFPSLNLFPIAYLTFWVSTIYTPSESGKIPLEYRFFHLTIGKL
jgi:hypothetical protein